MSATQVRKKTPIVTATLFDGKTLPSGIVNSGTTPQVVRTAWGQKSIPPGHGLLMTLFGPVPIAPGDQYIADELGSLTVCTAAAYATDYEPAPAAAEPTATATPATATAAASAPAAAAQPMAPVATN